MTGDDAQNTAAFMLRRFSYAVDQVWVCSGCVCRLLGFSEF